MQRGFFILQGRIRTPVANAAWVFYRIEYGPVANAAGFFYFTG